MHDTSNILEANGDRLWQTLQRSGEIGPGRSTGLSRLALTDEDRDMRDLFVTWCKDAGLTVSVDRVGNIFARRPGRDETLAPVLIGSHLDTQAAGGRYDGILGVLSGLEVIRVLNERGIETQRPIEVVNWTNEEGARFVPPMVASAVFAGALDLDTVLSLTDDDGAVFGAELERIGYAGDAPVGGREIDAYFELHIEQGPALEDEGLHLGIVTGGYQTVGMHIDIHGECAHSGPTPHGQASQRAGRRRTADRRGQRDRLALPRFGRQVDGTAPYLLAQQAGHLARLRPGDDRLPQSDRRDYGPHAGRLRSRHPGLRRPRSSRDRDRQSLGIWDQKCSTGTASLSSMRQPRGSASPVARC